MWNKKVEELYYPCSENQGADQLHSYCKADLCLCFRLCRLMFFQDVFKTKITRQSFVPCVSVQAFA